MTVPMIASNYRLFHQPKHSSRSGMRGILRGVVGSGIYGDVPVALAQWLLWAGRLHVGLHRVAGAGGWKMFWGDRRDGRQWQELE